MEGAFDWLADDSIDAARSLQQAFGEAARKIGERPLIGRVRLDLAPSR